MLMKDNSADPKRKVNYLISLAKILVILYFVLNLQNTLAYGENPAFIIRKVGLKHIAPMSIPDIQI